MHKQNMKQWGTYLATTLLLFGFFVSAFPSASFLAEPFAETAHRYFADYLGSPGISYLLQKDFGYFGLLPRTIFFVLVSVFKDAAFPEGVQTAVLLVMAMTMSIFVFDVFEPVVKSRLLRWMIVLLMASGHEYGMFLLHNCGYCFVFPVCYGLALFGVTKQYKKFMLILTAVMTVYIWSKGYSVIVIPALAYGVFDRIKQKDFFVAGCFCAALMLSIPQFYAVFQARNNFDAKPLSPFTIVTNVFYFYIYSWRYFSFGGSNNYDGALNQFYITLSVLILVWLRILTLKGERGRLLRSSFIGVQLLVLSGIGLFVVNMASSPVDFAHFPGFGTDSYFFSSRVAIAFSLGIVLSWYFEKTSSRPVYAVLMAFILFRSGVVSYASSHIAGKQDPYVDALNSASEWNTYYPLFQKNELHTVPINPPGWDMGWPAQAAESVAIVNKDLNTLILSNHLHSGIKGICIYPFDPDIQQLEVQSQDGIFAAPSFRKHKTKYPCYKWPTIPGDLPGVIVSVPATADKKNALLKDAKITFLY